MSVEADFYSAQGMFQRDTSATWTWDMADIDRFMDYSVVPGQANQSVEVTRSVVSTNNDLRPGVTLDVTLNPAPGLINFYAVRIPPI